LRQDAECVGQVTLTDYQRRPIKHTPIKLNLRTESSQAVPIGLDLVPVQSPVYDRHIDANPPATDPQLLQNDGVRLVSVFPEQDRA